MSKRNKSEKSWSLRLGSMVAGLFALTAVGCGGSNSSVSSGYQPGFGIPGTISCGTGVAVAGSCGVSFENACFNAGGYMVTGDMCRVSRTGTAYINTLGFIPRLNPGDIGGAAAWDTGVNLYVGDRFTLTASGGWGTMSSGSALWGLIRWYGTSSSSCSKVNVNGYGDDGSLVTYNGSPAAVMATDGGEVFQVGAGVTRTQARNGRLKIGLNVPYASDLCSNTTLTLTLTHCEMRGGQMVACP